MGFGWILTFLGKNFGGVLGNGIKILLRPGSRGAVFRFLIFRFIVFHFSFYRFFISFYRFCASVFRFIVLSR